MKLRLVIAITTFLSTASTLIAAPPTTEPAKIPAVEAAIQNRLAPHPRLLMNADDAKTLIARAAADPRVGAMLKRSLHCADEILKLPPLERKLIGKRLLSVSRNAQYRIATLALAYRATGDRKYLDGAVQNMLTVSAFTDFHPDHFLDVAEMTTALAVGYDWLWADLSADQRATIAGAIVDKGLGASFAKPMYWARGENNWNQVCNGGMVMGALAVAEDKPALAQRTIERALDGLPVIMRDYAPDGAYPEGANYWGYGTKYNCLTIAALESSLGDDFGLSRQADFLKTADYHLQIVGPTGLNFSYSDCSERADLQPAAYYLAKRRGEPSMLWNELKLLDEHLARFKVDFGSDADTWLALTWSTVGLSPVKPTATHYKGDGDTPVAIHRSSWDDDATFVGIHGGSPGTSHAHMDVGSFCLDAIGQRWAGDLGMQNYNSLESKGIDLWKSTQGAARWQVYRIGPTSHNILTVDGKDQVVSGKATIVKSTENLTIVDLGPVYAGQLANARRGIVLRPDKSVRLQDEIRTTPTAPATVRWAMLTHADVKIDGSTATLSQKGKRMLVHAIGDGGATWKVVSTDPPNEYDEPNPDSRLLVFERKLKPGESSVIVVDFMPGASRDGKDAVVPLDKW